MTERRLLVVDDERDFAEMVVRVATPLGYAATGGARGAISA